MHVTRKHFVKTFLLLIATFRSRNAVASVLNPKGKDLPSFSRVRPGDSGWPVDNDWSILNKQVNGRLMKMNNPFISPAADLFSNLKNPYYIGDTPELTQTTGWAKAWKSSPSVYVVAAESA